MNYGRQLEKRVKALRDRINDINDEDARQLTLEDYRHRAASRCLRSIDPAAAVIEERAADKWLALTPEQRIRDRREYAEACRQRELADPRPPLMRIYDG